jgi:hypothetical protein
MSGNIPPQVPLPTTPELLAAPASIGPVPRQRIVKQHDEAISRLAEQMIDECIKQRYHERLIECLDETHAIGRSYLGLGCGLVVAVFGLCVAVHLGGWPGAGVAALDLAVLTRVFVYGSLQPIRTRLGSSKRSMAGMIIGEESTLPSG